MSVELLGFLASLSSLTVILIGMTSQIMLNYRRKSCDGLSPILIHIGIITSFLWTLYGLLKPDFFISLSNIPGTMASTVVLCQFYYYKRKQNQR